MISQHSYCSDSQIPHNSSANCENPVANAGFRPSPVLTIPARPPNYPLIAGGFLKADNIVYPSQTLGSYYLLIRLMSDTRRSKIPRSLLFVPAIKLPEYAAKLADLRTDGLIFDLEDSVSPTAKVRARELLRSYLTNFPPKQPVYIRVNSIASPFYEEDMRLVADLEPDVLMLSKVESAEELRDAQKRTSSMPRTKRPPISLFAVVESLRGHSNRNEILSLLDENSLYALGYEDFSAELDIDRPEIDVPGPINTLLIENILCAKLKRIPIIDAISRLFKPQSMALFKKETEYGRSIGLCGKVAIHPNQLPLIHRVYHDESFALEQEQTLKAFNGLNDGSAVIVNNQGEMEDTPSLKRAAATLRRFK